MFKYFLSVFLVLSIAFGQDSKLPDAKLKDLENKTVLTSDLYKDGPVLINFWCLLCEPCRKEMKYLNDFHVKYEDQGFKVYSVNLDSPRSKAKVKSHVNSLNYSYQFLTDPKTDFFRKTGGILMPYTLLVDKDGNVVAKHMGYNPGDEINLEKEIREMLGLAAEVEKEG